MQIQLCEDDGCFHDGVPTMVVLVVKFDDGKQKRIPYSADRTISALYQDLQAIAPQVALTSDSPLIILPSEEEVKQASDSYKELQNLTGKTVLSIKPTEDKSHIIEKEDFVTMIRVDEGR